MIKRQLCRIRWIRSIAVWFTGLITRVGKMTFGDVWSRQESIQWRKLTPSEVDSFNQIFKEADAMWASADRLFRKLELRRSK